ncbi:MAG: methylmalonyl Co-A mutase-associated GTPase MeaB [Gemmatimonadales bacterium]
MAAPEQLERLLTQFGERRTVALARAISIVEDERPGFQDLLHALLARSPRAKRTGLTGPPGAGKSSLVAALAGIYRRRDEQLGIVAVDPTSPYTGGALLGDRIRMGELATDPSVFIRSMASRGSSGGLATTTKEVIDLMDAFGFERILIETVGVGQTELEITAAADTVIVVLVPESGDAIQAMKAGLMEIADVFVVNKSDRPGAARLVKEIQQSLHLRAGRALEDVPAHHGVDLSRQGSRPAAAAPPPEGAAWDVPVLATNALTGDGLDALSSALDAHRDWLEASGALHVRRRVRARARVRDVVERGLRRAAWASEAVETHLEGGLDRIEAGEGTAYSVAGEILGLLLR